MFKAKNAMLAACVAVVLAACGGGDNATATDTVAPKLDIRMTTGAPIAGETVTFTFSFDENVTGFDASDVQLKGGEKGAFTAVSAQVYTLVVTVFSANEALRLSVAPNAAQDTAGNAYAEGLIWESNVIQPVERSPSAPGPVVTAPEQPIFIVPIQPTPNVPADPSLIVTEKPVNK